MNDIEKVIIHLTMLRKLDSGEKKNLYDTAISSLENQLNNGWIATSERLPNVEECHFNSGWFLITIKAGCTCEAHYDGCKWVKNTAGMGHIDCTDGTVYEVLAWCLPEPYKEGE